MQQELCQVRNAMRWHSFIVSNSYILMQVCLKIRITIRKLVGLKELILETLLFWEAVWF